MGGGVGIVFSWVKLGPCWSVSSIVRGKGGSSVAEAVVGDVLVSRSEL